MKTLALLLLICAMAGQLAISHAQVRIPLKLDKPSNALPGSTLFCNKHYKCGLRASEQFKMSSPDGNPRMKVSRVGHDFYLLVDTNQDGRLTDEKRLLLLNSDSVRVSIRKAVGAKRFVFMPYEIVHEPPEENGEPDDQFVLRPTYIASGVLRYKTCESPISLLDMDFDGRFALADSDRGSNLRIDKNNDGRYWGKEEHLKSAEIVEYCGRNFLVTSLSNRSLVLTPTSLRRAAVNGTVPEFSLALLTGQLIGSESLRGRYYVLDFWASWCAPCVKNLPQIEAIRREYGLLSVFSVNVDKSSRRTLAEKIIQDAGIRQFTSIRGRGTDDPLWKTFGSTNSNRFAIPLYVLVDKDAVVRYVGAGGQNLIELRREIQKLLPPG